MTTGIIGCGKMAQALATGAHQSGAFEGVTVMVYDPVAIAMNDLSQLIDATPGKDLNELIEVCDTLVLCVKPDTVREVLETISRSDRSADKLLVISIAAGVTLENMEALLSSVGSVVHVKEKLMNAVTGLSGSGPAYIYTVIEALADGALLEGLPREQALELATQTVLGAAAMVRETGLHPAELRDRLKAAYESMAEGPG